jgi:hypothetical protein
MPQATGCQTTGGPYPPLMLMLPLGLLGFHCLCQLLSVGWPESEVVKYCLTHGADWPVV